MHKARQIQSQNDTCFSSTFDRVEQTLDKMFADFSVRTISQLESIFSQIFPLNYNRFQKSNLTLRDFDGGPHFDPHDDTLFILFLFFCNFVEAKKTHEFYFSSFHFSNFEFDFPFKNHRPVMSALSG